MLVKPYFSWKLKDQKPCGLPLLCVHSQKLLKPK